VTEIQENIRQVKAESRKEYEELSLEEHGLSNELDSIMMKFDAIVDSEKDVRPRQ
jgi:hypothetical protein